jgi:hypothetical protein
VTAATVLFVGAVSLFFSALCRRAHLVVFAGVLSTAFLFAVLPFLSFALLGDLVSERALLQTYLYWDPYLLLSRYTDYAISPRGPAFVSMTQIISCCVVLLLAAGLVLLGAIHLVESVALRRAMGDPTRLDRSHAGGARRWRRGPPVRPGSSGV